MLCIITNKKKMDRFRQKTFMEYSSQKSPSLYSVLADYQISLVMEKRGISDLTGTTERLPPGQSRRVTGHVSRSFKHSLQTCDLIKQDCAVSHCRPPKGPWHRPIPGSAGTGLPAGGEGDPRGDKLPAPQSREPGSSEPPRA